MKLKCSYILPHYFSVLYFILLFSLSIGQEVQPVPEFCSESPSTFSTFRIKSSASAAPLFPTVNTSLFMKYFEGYHLSNNEISSFQGNLTYFTTVYLDTNITALMVNPENNKTAYIGFGTEEVKESSDKERKIKFKFFFQFNSENLKKGSWDFEFGIHDDSMMCYYCLDEKHAKMSNITNPTKCKVDIQFKTWGARNIISSQVDLVRWVEDNSYRKFSNSKNYGGYFNRAQNGYKIFHVLMWIIPFVSYVVNVFHFDTKDIDINKNPIAIIGYICTSAITIAYIMFSFILFYLCEYFLENIITALFLPFFILMFLATVSCTCLIMYTALLDHKVFKNDNDPRASTNCITACMSLFWFVSYIIMMYWKELFFYKFFFIPSTYLALPSLGLAVNIVTNFVGAKAVVDNLITLIINNLYILYLPYSAYGPSEWIHDYTSSKLIRFLCIQLLLVLILYLQSKFGSRFILPSKLRAQLHDKYRRRLTNKPHDKFEDVCCYCLNKLSEPEVEYQSSHQNSLKYIKLNDNLYYMLPCTHKYHPCCFHTVYTSTPKCLKCPEEIPHNTFID